MDIIERPALPPEARTLPARYFIDPSYFEREFDLFYTSKWICVGHISQIPDPGHYFLANLGQESLIILRSRDSGLHGFFNVCRHRGTRLCIQESGAFSSSIQCPYHAWTWDLSGRLIGAPHMEESPGFDRADWPLKHVETGVWDGHVFVRLNPAPASLSHQLGSLSEKFSAWGMANLKTVHRVVYNVAANWKLIVQNYSECLHCPVIHPALNKLSHYLSGDNEPADSSHLGGAMMLREGIATMSNDGQSRRANLPGLTSDQARRVYFYAVLPNLLLSLHPDYMLVHRLYPIRCDRTEIVCEWFFHPEEVAKPSFDPSDAIEFWDLTNRQDWQVSELTQLGMSSRAYEPGPYSNREELLYAFDRLLLQELEGST